MRTATRTTRLLSLAVTAVLGLAATACGTSADPGANNPTQSSSSAPAASSAAAKQSWVVTDSATATGRPMGATVVRVSPNGRIVVVAGGGPTVAYDANSGKQLWQATEPGMSDGAAWLAVSPDGSAVYITGMIAPETADAAYRTVAYALADGKRLWAASYKGTGKGQHNAASLVATKALVIVDGVTSQGDSGTTVVTIAYDAQTGAQKWIARLDPSKNAAQGWFPGGARSLAVDSAGTAVYLTTGTQTGNVSAIATASYDAATGTRRWITSYESPDHGNAMGSAVAVSPDGETLVMTGMSEGTATKTDSVTIGYDATTGKQHWVRTYNGPANQNEGTGLVAFSPDGATVFAAGTSEGATVGHEDMIVLAYRTATGAQQWAVRWNGPAKGDDNASDLAAAPDGSSVVMVGRTVPQPMQDLYATVALQSSTGAVLWSNTYRITHSGDGNLQCNAQSVDIDKNGTVFVTGSAGAGKATVAYAPPR